MENNEYRYTPNPTRKTPTDWKKIRSGVIAAAVVLVPLKARSGCSGLSV